jgi:tRNA A-37 threonylcarbamoyl transferase component Bud32
MSPESMGYTLKRTGFFSRESVHFCEYIDNAKSLFDLVTDISDDELANILELLAIDLANIHRQGFVHGDTKLSNILVSGSSLYFVDLDSVKKITSKYSPERDVARLLVGLSEVLIDKKFFHVFMSKYCDQASINKSSFLEGVSLIINIFQKRHFKKYGREPVDINL